MAEKRRGSLTKREAVRLAQLLEKMGQDPSGYIPDEAWLAVQRTFALPYLELCIFRSDGLGEVEILLQYRKDEHWTGWNLPGALWRTKDSLEQGIERTLKAEGLSTLHYRFLACGDWTKWNDGDHYGHPISHEVDLLAPDGMDETEEFKWFSEVPSSMVHQAQAEMVRDALHRAVSYRY